jgi:glycosyltransferase involved in cell wall biosynthesis
MSIAAGNVLHVVDSLGLGGAQTILKAYLEANAGDRSKHLYVVRTVAGQASIAHPNVLVAPSSRRFSVAPLFALRRLVRERSIAVVHCHLFRAQVLGYLLKLFFFPGIALVFHEHGRVVGREGESDLEDFLFRRFLRLAARRVDRFVCISEVTRERLLAMVPEAREIATVVANPVPVSPQKGRSHDRAGLRRQLGVPDGAFLAGFAARLVRRKGWADFLEAIARVGGHVPVHFLMAGDGPERAKAEASLRALGLESRGRLLGPVDRMHEFYASLDCFVMPSHWEPHGLGQLEAQSFRVPVIVSRVPGLISTVHPEVDALSCPPGDVDCLARAIERLATEPALAQRLSAAGAANAARYSTAAFTQSLEGIYAEVAGRPAAGEVR